MWVIVSVYTGGLLYLIQNGNNPFLSDILDFDDGNLAVSYLTISSAFDGMPRNGRLWKKAATYIENLCRQAYETLPSNISLGKKVRLVFKKSFELAQDKGRIALTGFGCLLPSCIQPTYLITAELFVISQDPDLKSGAIGYMLGFCPFLFADSFASNFDTAWDFWDNVKDNVGELRSYLSKTFLHRVVDPYFKSQATLDGEYLEERLEKLSKFLFRAPLEKSNEIWTAVHNLIKASDNSQIGEEEASILQSFRVMDYLFGLGDQIVEGQKQIKSLYETFSDYLNYAGLVIGAPTRLLVLEFIGETLFGLFCPQIVTKILGWLFAIVGFPVQTVLEYQGFNKLARDFIWHQDPHGHSSHVGLRAFSKTYVVAQGLLFTLPLFVMVLQTYATWDLSNLWMISGGPFLVMEVAGQITAFNGTYNRQIATTITNVHNKVTRKKLGLDPRSDWKRDWLIQLIEATHDEIKKMSPQLKHFFREHLSE